MCFMVIAVIADGYQEMLNVSKCHPFRGSNQYRRLPVIMRNRQRWWRDYPQEEIYSILHRQRIDYVENKTGVVCAIEIQQDRSSRWIHRLWKSHLDSRSWEVLKVKHLIIHHLSSITITNYKYQQVTSPSITRVFLRKCWTAEPPLVVRSVDWRLQYESTHPHQSSQLPAVWKRNPFCCDAIRYQIRILRTQHSVLGAVCASRTPLHYFLQVFSRFCFPLRAQILP